MFNFVELGYQDRQALMFELLSTDPDCKARRGRLTTPHGVIETPYLYACRHTGLG